VKDGSQQHSTFSDERYMSIKVLVKRLREPENERERIGMRDELAVISESLEASSVHASDDAHMLQVVCTHLEHNLTQISALLEVCWRGTTQTSHIP
jgi:hypothetical protein